MKVKSSKGYRLAVYLATVFVLSVLLIPSAQKFARRMLNWPQNVSNIQNADSKLLPLLLQKDDFSEDWQWDLIITHQSSEDPLRGENRIIEFSMRQFVGLYKKYSGRVVHSIYQYEGDFNTSNINIDPSLESIGLNNIAERFTFHSSEVFDREPINCYFGIDNHQNTVSRCILVIQRNNILERVDIDIYNDLKKEIIKQAIIDIQNYLESRNSSR